MDVQSVEQLIRDNISLPNRPSAQGWYPVLCKVCNDHGNKGPRAAFKFEDGGVAYHCFNCKVKASYNPHEHTNLTKTLENILTEFGVDGIQIGRLKLHLLGENSEEIKRETKQAVVHEPAELSLPSHFKPLSYSSVWSEVAKEYLSERMIDPEQHPFMISTGICEDLNSHPKQIHKAMITEAEAWVGRVIIPMYKGNKLIYYTGRDMTDKKKQKYKNPSSPKHNVLFGFDNLFDNSDKPLYVVEGIFDALVINGIAVLGNELSASHLYWLNRSSRPKVYIPDRFGDGGSNAIKAVEEGWSVGFPDVGNCKDINDAVQKYGKLYVLTSINKNTASGFAARARIGIYCKK